MMKTAQDFLDSLEEDVNESVLEEHNYIRSKRYEI